MINASVGLGGVNRLQDVHVIQALLNQNRHRVANAPEIAVDGIVGPKTLAAIRQFQIQAVMMRNADSRVDPNGMTLQALTSGAIADNPTAPGATPAAPTAPESPPAAPSDNGNGLSTTLRFPLKQRPRASYKTGGRYFGARRSNGRLHAGCDLIASVGTDIVAVADGEILAYYLFYSGTYAAEVRHDDGFVVRYGEVSGLAAGLRIGSQVTRGQVIAYVGRLNSGSSMLHFELYSGSATGRLTVRSNTPYQRRSDLLDPTNPLDQASMQ